MLNRNHALRTKPPRVFDCCLCARRDKFTSSADNFVCKCRGSVRSHHPGAAAFVQIRWPMQSCTDEQEVWPPAYKSSTRRTHPKHTSRRPPTVPLRSPDVRGNTHATQDRNGDARPALSPKAGPAHRATASPPPLKRYALQEDVPQSQPARAFQVCGVSTGRRGSSGTVIPANQSTAHHAPAFTGKKKTSRASAYEIILDPSLCP